MVLRDVLKYVVNQLKTRQFLIVLGLFLLFVLTAPFTVQSGDTGELVSNSFFLRVSHPPGYPLWTLLYHLPVKYLTFLTPFHSASIFTALISCLWMGILAFRFPTKAGLSLLLVLATSLIFWRYSILPDVFSLHLFFLVLVFIAFNDPALLRNKWIIFLISLSVTNHHTIVFAFPLYVYSVLQGNRNEKLLYSLLFGFLSGSAYFLLLSFHTEDYGSWGNLKSFLDVWNHFIRAEYGTFRLQSLEVKKESFWFSFFIKNFLLNSWSVLVAFLYLTAANFKIIKQHWFKLFLLGFCIVIYFITFVFGEVMSLDGFGETVIERFFLQPTLFIFFIVFMITSIPGVKIPQWLIMAFVVNAGLNVVLNFKENNYRNNTYIEDFALNSFRILPPSSVFLTHGDTPGSSAYYVHEVLGFRPDVILIHPSYAFKWSEQKIHRKHPEVFVNDRPVILESIDYNKYKFFMNIPPSQLPEGYGLDYFGIVFNVYRADEVKPSMKFTCELSKLYVWRHRTELEDLENFENSRIYDLEYGRCDYVKGWEQFRSGNQQDGLNSLQKAVELSPLSVKYTERLCHIYAQLRDLRITKCEETLSELLAFSNKQYYFYTYEK